MGKRIDSILTAVLFATLFAGSPTFAQGPREAGGPAPDFERAARDAVAKLVDVPMPGGAVSRAYVAHPKGAGPYPAILILHGTEGFAVTQIVLANDFAAAGFITVAACWFKGSHLPPGWRTPPGIPCPNGPEFDGANMQTADNALALLEFVRTLPGVDRDRIGVWGQSRGATISLLLAAQNAPARAFVAAAPIYAYPKRGGAYRDDFPIKFLDRIKRPVLMLQGTSDQIIPVDEAREFEAAARAAAVNLDAEYYPGEGHNLFYIGSQREASRDRAIAFFRKNLGGN